MKRQNFWNWGLVLALTALTPAIAPGAEAEATAAPALSATNSPPGTPLLAETNATSVTTNGVLLELAPGQVVSTPATPPSNVRLAAPAAEVVKLAQAGVDENVMLSFVTNSTSTFNLNSDAIIYLNDLGVADSVVAAMIQHDQLLKVASLNPGGMTASPAYADQGAVAVSAPTPYAAADAVTEPVAAEAPAPETVEEAPAPPTTEVSYTHFYDALAPYGTWINVPGYGMCWQPTAVLVNPGWQPYCHGGRWVYTDCGWYWASDYSWGWAPFHYGRWFQHQRWGWCWVPDTVWGPSWVNWRYTSGYCGWAPLPPAACYTPGFGFSYWGTSVGFSFYYGLAPSCYTFVPINRFCDRRPHHYRLPPSHAEKICAQSVAVSHFADDRNHRVVNKGIPVDRIAAATRTTIRPVPVRDTASLAANSADRLDRGGRTLTVFRPKLPAPNRQESAASAGARTEWRGRNVPRGGTAPMDSAARRSAGNLNRESGTVAAPGTRNSLILRGSASAGNQRTVSPPVSAEAATTQPAQPAAPAWYGRPVQNTPRAVTTPAPRQVTAPPPQVGASAPAPNPPQPPDSRRFFQPSQHNQQPAGRVSVPAAAPPPSQPAVRATIPSAAPSPSRNQQWSSPAPAREAPARVESSSPPPAPRVESRQSPPAQSSSSSQQSGRPQGSFGRSR